MSEKTIAIKARRYHRLTAEADKARAALIDEVHTNITTGMSEYSAADAAGVTRLTIRKWLGKS